MTNKNTIFKRLGGRAAIEAAVKSFYDKVLADPDLEPYFVGIERKWIESQQAKFFMQALGGPALYDGASMSDAHARLPLTNENFDAVAEHLSKTLDELGVASSLRDEVIGAVAPLRSQIVGAAKPKSGGSMSAADKRVEGLSNLGDGALLGTLSSLQTNLFVANTDFVIIYMNERAHKTLDLIADDVREAFRVEISEIHGGSIHRFHRNPQLVEKILRDPSALPHEAEFSFGRVTLSSTINSVHDERGNVVGYVVNWEDVSARVVLEREQARVHSMMESAPTNVILANRDLRIQYLNQASKKTLRQLERWLPVKTADFLGTSIDVFHKNPEVQRRIVSDPENLPHMALIDIGPEKVSLLASAISDSRGEYLGPMITWEIITEKLQTEQAMARINSMMENAPTNVILADSDLKIQYMNPASVETMRRLEKWLPVKVDDFLGTSIDVFHKNPEVQRRIVGDPANLPHNVLIDIGPERVDLLASAIMDDKGNYLGPMITWEIVTEKLQTQQEMARVHSMMENAPTNVIYADRDLNIAYMNAASIQTMSRLEQWLPIRVDQFMGSSIDVFHKNPTIQRRIVGDPQNLPHRTVIDIGPEKADLLASAIYDDKGTYLGPMITWELITEKLETDRKVREMAEREKEHGEELRRKVDLLLSVVDAAGSGDLTRTVEVSGEDAIGKMGEGLDAFFGDLRTNISGIAARSSDLAQSAESLESLSHQMAGSAEQTSSQASLVSEGAKQVNVSVKSVSAGVEEMNASIREVARNATEAAEVATNAVEIAREANKTVSKLGQSSNEIGNVVRVITSIAQQTKLLALNATIEAARAGEAGKGFAVVANEVKELAKETANATEDISRKIEAIQGDTGGAIEAIERISEIIGNINDLQNRIAGAVEQQSATSNSVAQNLGEAAQGTDEITQNIAGVAEAAGETSKAASETQSSAQDLAALAGELRKIVQRFTY